MRRHWLTWEEQPQSQAERRDQNRTCPMHQQVDGSELNETMSRLTLDPDHSMLAIQTA